MSISLFCDHLTVLDFAYLDNHLGLVGDSLNINVEFIGTQNEEGMVFDFSKAKKKVKQIIDRECDHRLALPKGLLQTDSGRAYLAYNYGVENKLIEYWAPEQAFCEIPCSTVTENAIISYLEEIIIKEMPENVDAVKLSFEREVNSRFELFFHYTHGLREHDGNCQRLFHGHRNSIEVYINGKRSKEWEVELMTKHFSGNIHFVYWDNIQNKDEIIQAMGNKNPIGRVEKIADVHIKYLSNQGEFESVLPAQMCFILPIESTVENLAMFFAQFVKSKTSPNTQVMVKAFEGIRKGAIANL